MDSQGSVREGCQGLCRLHPCYLCGNQCQKRHQHQRSVYRNKWVCSLNVWHLWLLVPSHRCSRHDTAFKYLSTSDYATSLLWLNPCTREGNEARAVYILSPSVFFLSSRFIVSLLLPKQPWTIKVCWSCAAISSTKDALLGSMKWCCCYLPD